MADSLIRPTRSSIAMRMSYNNRVRSALRFLERAIVEPISNIDIENRCAVIEVSFCPSRFMPNPRALERLSQSLGWASRRRNPSLSLMNSGLRFANPRYALAPVPLASCVASCFAAALGSLPREQGSDRSLCSSDCKRQSSQCNPHRLRASFSAGRPWTEKAA